MHFIVLINFSHLNYSASSKSQTKRNPNAKHEKLSFELLARAIQKTPK